MNTTKSTLGSFVLKSYVSVLREAEKEITLKIVGGGDPPGDDRCDDYLDKVLNINDCNAWDCIDYMFDFAGEEGLEDPYFEVDDDGNIIDWHWGDPPADENNNYTPDDWEEWKDENSHNCLATNY
ncbi:MAG: hypothetical protein LBV02_09125 [Bacteroidales bacterium]|jgi:hypothetical protein|nr:hypothetical protein [Bacteroidales bacterium]